MTNNTDTLTALFTDAIRSYDATIASSSSPFFRMMRDLHELAAHELLACFTNNSNYYHSDSTYDEFSNPSRTIALCDQFNDFFYDDDRPDYYITLIPELLDCLDYELSFRLSTAADDLADDESPIDLNIPAIAAAIREQTALYRD